VSEKIILKIKLKKHGEIKEKIIKTQIKEVKKLKKPYLEYHILEKDISRANIIRFNKGYYNATLYIPE
jgi:hypothetical protein